MNQDTRQPLILGVDYYPEHWPAHYLEKDLADIKATGANTIRIGEFAWHLMEPRPGQFDFSFFDHVIEKAAQAGLQVIFGTPTATFPAWLAAAHPEVLSRDAGGQPRAFGGRRQYCFNSPVYRSYARRITDAVVAHYSQAPAVIAWQLDNELGHEGSDLCWCDTCRDGFRSWLHSRYGTVEALNEAWGTIFWGQTYNGFEEVPIPTPTITLHNPALQLDWARFRSDSLIGFAQHMAEGIRRHKGAHQPLTHNLFGGWFDRNCDQHRLAELLDVVSYDNYPVWGGLMTPISPAHCALGLDYMRGLKQRNFWILEQLMGAQGHAEIGYLPRPGQALMWSHQAMARGCEALLYFRWRGMTQGAEQFCLGLVDPDNRMGRKVQEAAAFFGAAQERASLYREPVQASVALLYDYDTIRSWGAQPQSAGFDYTSEALRLYEPFHRLNLNLDVIPFSEDFSRYRVVLLPVQQLADEALALRLEVFASSGGTVVFSYRTGIRNFSNNLHLGMAPPGPLAALCGIAVPEAESLGREGAVPVVPVPGFEAPAGCFRVWRDLMTPHTAQALYTYGDAPYTGYAAVTVNPCGQGRVYCIGGGADAPLMGTLARRIAAEAGLEPFSTPEGVEAVHRTDTDGTPWRIWLNHTGAPADIGCRTLEPYGVWLQQL